MTDITPTQIADFMIRFNEDIIADPELVKRLKPAWIMHTQGDANPEEKRLFQIIMTMIALPLMLGLRLPNTSLEGTIANAYFTGFQCGRAYAERELQMEGLAKMMFDPTRSGSEGESNG
jgi:hypothetical protein